MQDKKMLGEFIYELRKEKGYSQAELGVLVGVSNKAVSKWETDEANPDLGNIQRLAQVLGVTADELLSCRRREAQSSQAESVNEGGEACDGCPLGISGIKAAGLDKIGPREYISRKKTKKGTPYVHINFSKFSSKARGIVAIGFRAKGILSIGLLTFGIFSIGFLSFGIVAFGTVALGLAVAMGAVAAALGAAFGGIAAGAVAFGGIAIGYLAFGGIAIGYYAHTGINGLAYGAHLFYH